MAAAKDKKGDSEIPEWKQKLIDAEKTIGWSTKRISRPYVTVQKAEPSENEDGGKEKQTIMPCVFMSPIRPDLIKFVFHGQNKNTRQPYAVFVGAGHQHSAESWGTGRAVSRIPRVSGGGTSRAGQGAFGNMCRSGRMFAPTKTWRKWHYKITLNQRRYATASAIAASSVAALVEARGHKIGEVPEIPLVVDDAVESFTKTKKAIALLERLGAYEDVEKVKNSRHIRAGKGKMRNRRYVQSTGPLIVYKENKGIVSAFRNLPGVKLVRVEHLSVLKLAPGGAVGRFIIWTESAFKELATLWGSWRHGPNKKMGFRLPRPLMTHPDVGRILNSATVQAKLRPKRSRPKSRGQRKNPLKNFGTMVRLNPYALALRRASLIANGQRERGCAPSDKAKKRKKKEVEWRKRYNYRRIATQSTIVISKEQAMKNKARRKRLQGNGRRLREAKLARLEEEKEYKAKMKALKEKALKDPKARPTLKQIKKMIERKVNPPTKKSKKKKRPEHLSLKEWRKREKFLKSIGKAPKKQKKKSKKKKKGVSGAKVSEKPEEAKPFKTYDNDTIMGKEAPVEAIRNGKYIQGSAPKKGVNLVVLLWRKSYKNGYKFMPLYSALADEFKGKPVAVVGCCLDRDKNAASGFLKKYHNGPKGNFTTTFAVVEEWAPPNKVRPLTGRPIEAGFLDHMMDLHPGMKEIPSIPHMFLVNSSGTVVWHQDHSERGAVAPDHMEEIKEQVSRLISGKVLLSLGTKVVAGSESDESSSSDDDGAAAAGDMGDFFTGL